MVLQKGPKTPVALDVLREGLGFVLGEDVDGVDAGVHEVVEDEVNDAVLGPEGHGGLGPLGREGVKPATLASGKNHSQHFHLDHPSPPFTASLPEALKAGPV